MKKLIILTFLTIIVAIGLVTTISVVKRSIEYKYSSVATDQVNDYTNSYEILRTQKGILTILDVLVIGIILISLTYLLIKWSKQIKIFQNKMDK